MVTTLIILGILTLIYLCIKYKVFSDIFEFIGDVLEAIADSFND